MSLPTPPPQREWRQATWQHPVDPDAVAGAIRQWAADQRGAVTVLELRLSKSGAVYLISYSPTARHQVLTPLGSVPNLSLLEPLAERTPVITAGRVRASTRHRPLRFDNPQHVVRALLSSITRLHDDELLVLQVMLGPRCVPLAVPDRTASSAVAPWYSVAWIGNGGQIDSEKRRALRAKISSDFGFACTLRLGVTAARPDRRKSLLLTLFAALRVTETPGLQLRFQRERPHHLNVADTPWHWPLRLSVPELVGLTGYPFDEDLPGQPAPHPRPLPPAPGATGSARVVADSTVPGRTDAICLPLQSATHGTHVLGPTGVGKSNLQVSLILSDIAAGVNVIVIEPKGDLVADVLARMPSQRADDVVVLDPSDDAPVGFNPLASGGRRPDLVADAILTLFKQLYGSAIGPRSQDLLYGGLLTLAHQPGSSLVELPLLFTNPNFRRRLTAHLRDPLVLEPFWASFDAWSEAERANAVAPVMNKLRPLLRPGLRGVLGQPGPRFHLREVFEGSKLLFAPLQRGVIGTDASRLLGSLVVSSIWNEVQARARIPVAARKPVMVYIDEVQDYIATGTDLGEALAQARGYGVGFTLAHQFLNQLPPDLRSAVLANARSRICFQLQHADAIVMAKGHPELTVADFEALPQFQVYASVFARGQVTPYASGRTRQLPAPTTDPDALRRRSRERYGRPLADIEADFARILGESQDDPSPTGRRRRTT